MTADTTFDTTAVKEPLSVAALGIDPSMVRDLALKSMFYGGRFTRSELAAELCVSVPVVEEVLSALNRDGLVSVLAAESGSPNAYIYTLTSKGYQRAEEALSRNRYVGPVPVPLADYVARMRAQAVSGVEMRAEDLARALSTLVLSDDTARRIGWAVASRKPLLLYGESGNGKTTLARTVGSVVGGTITIPYAIEIVGQVVRIFDQSKHERLEEGPPRAGDADMFRARSDRRWVEVRRPLIWAGGELTRQSLELAYDADTRIYEAPLQLKANGGILIIDDLGRQQISAVQLLNRWIVALESGSDHLTLHTGQTVEIPFDALIMFSTNLPPQDLADEAFLRRIRYKVHIDSPGEEEYREIFRRECIARGLPYDDDVVRHLFDRWYRDGREMRGCHPRDLIDAVFDAAAHARREPALTIASIDEACRSYFL